MSSWSLNDGEDILKMPRVPIGCLELDIPLSVLQKCQELDSGQKLEMFGTNRKLGTASKLVKPQDITIAAELDNSFLKLSMFSSSMGTLFRKKLTGTWNCEITKTSLDTEPADGREADNLTVEEPANDEHNTEKAPGRRIRQLRKRPKYVDEPEIEDMSSDNAEDVQSNYALSVGGDSNIGEVLEDLLSPDINPKVVLENIDDQLKDLQAKTEIEDAMSSDPIEVTPLNVVEEDEFRAAMSTVEISMTEELDLPKSGIKLEDGTTTSMGGDPMLLTTCPVCNRSYETSLKLRAHMKRKHKGETPFPCTLCGERFPTAVKLRIHFKTHKTVRCDYCGKGFANKKRCLLHIRTHTGEKPFACRYCPLRFARKPSAYEHERIHKNERPYVCTTCGQSFRRKTHLQRHNRVHSGERPLVCNICGKDFPTTSYLKVHMSIHTGYKQFVCQVCGKAFHASNTLKRHMRIHTGEKPYTCDICAKSFNQNNSLKSHMRIHTGEKPYVCLVCGEAFKQSCSLLTHSKRHQKASNTSVDVGTPVTANEGLDQTPGSSGDQGVRTPYHDPVFCDTVHNPGVSTGVEDDFRRAYDIVRLNDAGARDHQTIDGDNDLGRAIHPIVNVTETGVRVYSGYV